MQDIVLRCQGWGPLLPLMGTCRGHVRAARRAAAPAGRIGRARPARLRPILRRLVRSACRYQRVVVKASLPPRPDRRLRTAVCSADRVESLVLQGRIIIAEHRTFVSGCEGFSIAVLCI